MRHASRIGRFGGLAVGLGNIAIADGANASAGAGLAFSFSLSFL